MRGLRQRSRDRSTRPTRPQCRACRSTSGDSCSLAAAAHGHVQRVVAVVALILMQPARQRSHVELEVHVDGRFAREPCLDRRFEPAQPAMCEIDAVAARAPAIALERKNELARAHGRMNRATSQPSSTRPTQPTAILPSTSLVSQRSHGSGAPDKASSPGAARGGTSYVIRMPPFAIYVASPELTTFYSRQSSPGMMRRMNSSNSGTVKAVSPWLGLKIMPFAISWLRIGASDVTLRPNAAATSPERCGPGPSSAIARRYFFSASVNRSKRTRKKLSSSAAIATRDACSTSARTIGERGAASQVCLPHSWRKYG